MLEPDLRVYLVPFDLAGNELVVPDRLERRADLCPRHVALKRVAESRAVADVGFEVLNVHLLDAAAKDAYPLIGISIEQNVAGVEVGADERAADLVQVAGELERAEQKLVPDVL